MSLDRRRLEEGFLLYASLIPLEKYNIWEQVGAIPYDRNEMVELVTREFNVAFIKRWAGEQYDILLNLFCITGHPCNVIDSQRCYLFIY